MAKPVIVSGIQPTGALHIGNYLGALKNFVELQNSGEHTPFFFIADLHSLTIDYTPEEKHSQILDVAASYLAAGLNPKKSTLFIQSHIPAHTELGWILSCFTPIGELRRMTQFKDKKARFDNQAFEEIKEIIEDKSMSRETAEKIFHEMEGLSEITANIGLFTYPTLMAADILLYDAAAVPVGDDQDQHLELARTIARKFNGRFGQMFVEPKSKHTAIPRLMSLDNPAKKMSKSLPAGCLFMDDAPEVIEKKIMTAVTDSGKEIKFDAQNKAGVSNLLMIQSALTGTAVSELENKYAGMNYGEFKRAVAKTVVEHFAPFRAAKLKLLKNPKKVLGVFEAGAKKAAKVADKKLSEIKSKIGLI